MLSHHVATAAQHAAIVELSCDFSQKITAAIGKV